MTFRPFIHLKNLCLLKEDMNPMRRIVFVVSVCMAVVVFV